MLDFFIFVSIRFVDGRLLWFKMINASTVRSSCYCYVLCCGGTDFSRVGKSHQKQEGEIEQIHFFYLELVWIIFYPLYVHLIV